MSLPEIMFRCIFSAVFLLLSGGFLLVFVPGNPQEPQGEDESLAEHRFVVLASYGFIVLVGVLGTAVMPLLYVCMEFDLAEW